MKVVGKHHPNIFQFVDALKREQAATELKVAQHDAAILPPQKKKNHIVTYLHLAVLKQEYDSGRRAVLSFLRAAGHLLKPDMPLDTDYPYPIRILAVF